MNVVRVARYRMALRFGIHPVCRLKGEVPAGPFFRACEIPPLAVSGTSHWNGTGLLFSNKEIEIGTEPPDWLSNPISGQVLPRPDRPWWQIPDFDPAVGDIKLIWELSRMDWLLAFAQRARQGDGASLDRLNRWLEDWCLKNPPYRGPNWKCGQEASLRVFHLAVAAKFLGQVSQPCSGLVELVRLHLRRIAPTISYAIGQDNNHGTSEAAALYIGGSWLERLGQPEGSAWRQTGLKWLEDRAQRLIGEDGTFSQYSVNYHRLMLDTYSLVELWRRELDLPGFSGLMMERIRAATDWLYSMIDRDSGDVPNVGANDGARILQTNDSAFRDFRPSIALAAALFHSRAAYADHEFSRQHLAWMGVPQPAREIDPPHSRLANDGGFAVLRHDKMMVLLRYPQFRFRPGQADALHLDFWVNGVNLFRDAGSFSYHADVHSTDYFNGAAGHNTIQFDDRDQMPRIGRFLFGDWLQTTWIEPMNEGPDGVAFGAEYVDSHKTCHRRCVRLTERTVRIIDDLQGFRRNAVLRWRLPAGNWELHRDEHRIQLRCGGHEIVVDSTMPAVRCELVDGWESRRYLEKQVLTVLEIQFDAPGRVATTYNSSS